MSSTKSQVALATNIPTNISSAASASSSVAAAAAVVVVASASNSAAAVASSTPQTGIAVAGGGGGGGLAGTITGSASGSGAGSVSGSGASSTATAAITSSSSVVATGATATASATNNSNSNNNSGGNVIYNSGMNYKAADRHERHERHEMSSQNSNLSNNHDEESYHYEGPRGGGKKHRANANSKGNKPRLKNIGGSSSGSIDGGGGERERGFGGGANGGGGGGMPNNCNSNNSSNNTSGFISRVFHQSENSSEHYTDFGGTDLLMFFRDTLNKNPKDRNILLKIEKDLIDFIQDNGHDCEFRFPPASSYNRMLIHRTAAFFGMEHNVDTETQQCVIVAATKGTRIPEIRFQSLVREDVRKSILKRDTHSFDEVRQSPYLCPERVMLDRKAKSFEEREEDYDRARSRIFSRTGTQDYGDEDCYGGWEQQQQQQQQQQKQQQPPRPKRPNGKMLQMQNSTESRDGMRSGGAVPKSHNFGNYGGPPSAGGPGNGGGNSLPRGDSSNSIKSGRGGFAKQDSTGSNSTAWRLSPSSSGYKTRTQSVRSDSVTPSPTGYGSDRQTPELSQPMPNRMGMGLGLGLVGGGGGGSSSYQQQAAAAAASTTSTAAAAAAAAASSSSSSSSASTASNCSGTSSGLVWAVTDISNVPIGSLLIDPQTLQPIVNADGSIYHYDPSNLPPNQALQHAGNQYQSGNNNSGSYSNYRRASPHQPQQQQQHHQQPPQQQQQSQQQQQQPPPQQQQQVYATNELSCSSTESYAEEVQSPGMDCSEGYESGYMVSEQQPLPQQQQLPVQPLPQQTLVPQQPPPLAQQQQPTMPQQLPQQQIQLLPPQQLPQQQQLPSNEVVSAKPSDDCDSSLASATACLSITTSTSTKNYDRIEVQKYKNQATSPNIPACCAAVEKEMEAAAIEEEEPDEPLPAPSTSASSTSSSGTGTAEMPPSSSQTPLPVVVATQMNCDVQSVSPSSTPYSQCEVKPVSHLQGISQGVPVEEPKTTWTYTQSYQAPDGSTVFHTTTTPNGAAPYCATTYQQGPDGSIYAVPQGMVYAAYPQAGVTSAGAGSQPLFQLTTSTHPPGQTLFASPEAGGELSGGTYMIPVFDPAQQQREGLIQAQAIYQAGPGGPATAVMPMPAAAAYPGAQFAAAGPNGAPIYQAPLIYSSEPGGPQLQQLPMASYPIQYSYPYYHPIPYYVPQQAVAAAPMVATAQPQGGQGAHTQALPGQSQPGHATASAAGPPTVSAAQQHHHHQQQQQIGNGGQVVTTSGYMTGGGGGGGGGSRVKRTPGGGSIHYNPSYPQTSVGHATAAHHPGPGATQLIAAPSGGTTTYHALPTLTLAHGGAANSQDLSAAAAAAAAGAHCYILPAQHATAPIPTNIFPYAAAAAAVGQAGSQPGAQVVQQQQQPLQQSQAAPHHTLIAAAPFYPAGAGSVDPGASQSAPSTPAAPGRQAPLFSTPPAPNNSSTGSSSGGGGGGGGYHSNSSTPHYYQSSNEGGYVPSYEKRNNNNGGSSGPPRKPYHPGGYNPRHSVPLSGIPSGAKTPLLNSNNEPTPRASPSISLGGGGGGGGGGGPLSSSAPPYHHRGPPPHVMNKREGKPNQLPLISGPPPSYAPPSNPGGGTSYESKPPVRLNAAAASFRSQKSMNTDYRRSVSQRNSPSANGGGGAGGGNGGAGGGNGSHESSNNSPNSIVSNSNNNSAANTPNAAPASALVSHTGGYVVVDQATGAAMNASPPSIYMSGAGSNGGGGGNNAGAGGPRASHIPAQLHHSAAAAAAAGAAGQQTTAAVLSAALGGYNPNGASGVYFKYGQTYFAHPSVALPNSRRSPSNDIRPQMAQMAGMYPTMMIQARHPSRHPNPNYKGSRPR
ncbi:protein encore isoform X5 [Drosophila subobscura]|uniref:protein encore isoform X5 n=1 Tax=Drosophila subobscura TaxID=7241 RepID=UPI00155A29F7|nr:protein encore isoform X5 [Drosophila subobscura]